MSDAIVTGKCRPSPPVLGPLGLEVQMWEVKPGRVDVVVRVPCPSRSVSCKFSRLCKKMNDDRQRDTTVDDCRG